MCGLSVPLGLLCLCFLSSAPFWFLLCSRALLVSSLAPLEAFWVGWRGALGAGASLLGLPWFPVGFGSHSLSAAHPIRLFFEESALVSVEEADEELVPIAEPLCNRTWLFQFLSLFLILDFWSRRGGMPRRPSVNQKMETFRADRA